MAEEKSLTGYDPDLIDQMWELEEFCKSDQLTIRESTGLAMEIHITQMNRTLSRIATALEALASRG